MSQCRILVDSNAYFRLAQSIHPLLNVVFGKKRYCLYVIKELQIEYNRNPRLKNEFSWVNDPEYTKNRSRVLEITREEKAEIKRAYDFILDYVNSVHPGVSKGVPGPLRQGQEGHPGDRRHARPENRPLYPLLSAEQWPALRAKTPGPLLFSVG